MIDSINESDVIWTAQVRYCPETFSPDAEKLDQNRKTERKLLLMPMFSNKGPYLTGRKVH